MLYKHKPALKFISTFTFIKKYGNVVTKYCIFCANIGEKLVKEKRRNNQYISHLSCFF